MPTLDTQPTEPTSPPMAPNTKWGEHPDDDWYARYEPKAWLACTCDGEIIGVSHIMSATAMIDPLSVDPKWNGEFTFDYDGYIEPDYESVEVIGAAGEELFVCETGHTISRDKVRILVEES